MWHFLLQYLFFPHQNIHCATPYGFRSPKTSNLEQKSGPPTLSLINSFLPLQYLHTQTDHYEKGKRRAHCRSPNSVFLNHGFLIKVQRLLGGTYRNITSSENCLWIRNIAGRHFLIFQLESSHSGHYILPTSIKQLPTIHNLLRCLKSVGTKMALIWIPSHTRIPGNEIADKLTQGECSWSSRSRIRNRLSAVKQLFIFRESWMEDWLNRLKSCQKSTTQQGYWVL